MSFGDHPLDHSRPRRRLVDRSLPIVVPGDEEGGLEVVGSKQVQQVVGVDVRTIIVRQPNHTIAGAVVDVGSVRDGAQHWTRNVRSGGPRGSVVRVASPKPAKTVWRSAVFLSRSTETRWAAALASGADLVVVSGAALGVAVSAGSSASSSTASSEGCLTAVGGETVILL